MCRGRQYVSGTKFGNTLVLKRHYVKFYVPADLDLPKVGKVRTYVPYSTLAHLQHLHTRIGRCIEEVGKGPWARQVSNRVPIYLPTKYLT